jgi:8-oxo-dGTP diphosphatase
MQIHVYAKSILIDEHGRILLLRRSMDDDQRAGEQDYPGGSIEPGEDLAAGASREILEETGLTIGHEKLQLIYGQTEAYGDRSVTRLLFWGRVENAQVKLSFEHDDFHWATPDDAVREFPHPFYGVGLQYALRHNLFAS